MSSSSKPLDRWDAALAVAIGLGALALYLRTMPPSLLDGDSGRWQYVSYALGIPYVTGYPIQVLLGKLWSLLIPFFSVAYRFSLFSVCLGAINAGLSYLLFRKVTAGRAAAVCIALLFATLASTWWWMISIKAYALNLAFVSGCFLLLFAWGDSQREGLLRAFAAVYGLSLTNHSTMVLFAPAFAAFILLTDAAILRSPRRLAILILCALAPLLLYAYIPLRGASLWYGQGAEPGLPWPVAVSRGLISSEYAPTWDGLWRLLLASSDTQSLLTSWSELPRQLWAVYGPLVTREFGWTYILLGLSGLVRLLLTDVRKGLAVGLGFLAFPPFVVKYGHGMQAAFLLPCNLMLAAGIASALDGVFGVLSRLGKRDPVIVHRRGGLAIAAQVLLAVLVAAAIVAGATSRFERMDRSTDYAVRRYWERILSHPLEDKAGLLAHSGVLTSLWYLQQVEGQRPDLFGLFPPDENVVDNWLKAGHSLYLAGPLEGWLPKAWERYRLTPWGILVRLAPYDTPDETSWLRPAVKKRMAFGEALDLLGYDLGAGAAGGGSVPLRLHWRTKTRLPADYLVSLRLVDAWGQRAAIIEDRLVSAWYPESAVPEGRFMLGVYDVPVPAGTLPGTYTVEMVVHHPETGEELKPAGRSGPFALGTVEVAATPPGAQADLAGLQPGGVATFGEAIRLAGYSVAPSELKPGEPLTLETLWQAVHPPSGTYTLTLQWVDDAGTVRGESAAPPLHGSHPTSIWTAGEWVRDRTAMIAPTGLSNGVYEVRLGWTGADGRPLDLRRGLWPAGQFMPVATVRVTERAHRHEPPAPAVRVEADFAGQARLVGYDLAPSTTPPGETLALTLYWLAPGFPGPAPRQMASSYKVFVHLIDGNGQIVAQRDSVPAQGDRPTMSWVPGEFITDGYTLDLPASLPPGDYALWVGLYDPVSGLRLILAPSGADGLHLADVQVGNR